LTVSGWANIFDLIIENVLETISYVLRTNHLSLNFHSGATNQVAAKTIFDSKIPMLLRPLLLWTPWFLTFSISILNTFKAFNWYKSFRWTYDNCLNRSWIIALHLVIELAIPGWLWFFWSILLIFTFKFQQFFTGLLGRFILFNMISAISFILRGVSRQKFILFFYFNF